MKVVHRRRIPSMYVFVGVCKHVLHSIVISYPCDVSSQNLSKVNRELRNILVVFRIIGGIAWNSFLQQRKSNIFHVNSSRWWEQASKNP